MRMRYEIQRQDEFGVWQPMAAHDDFRFAMSLLTDKHRRIRDTELGCYIVFDPSQAKGIRQPLGIMGSDPVTGECFAVYAEPDGPRAEERAELMARGTLFQRAALPVVKKAYCEVHPSRRVVRRGPSVGRYLDADIPAWIEMADGSRHEYVGICGPVVDFSTLKDGQMALAPGLIYQPASQQVSGI